ncbi:MAG TPA: DUF1622 domain-containing protein [Chitinophagaceae bacterium]
MQETAVAVTLFVSHAAEAIAAVLIGLGLVQLVFRYVRSIFITRAQVNREDIRIRFGSVVATALELMLGADVLATAVAPDWDDIGKLGAIAIIRTALNYFLAKELKEFKRE